MRDLSEVLDALDGSKIEEWLRAPIDPDVVRVGKAMLDAYRALETLSAAQLYDLKGELTYNLRTLFDDGDGAATARCELSRVVEYAMQQKLAREVRDEDYAFCVVGRNEDPWEVFRYVLGETQGMMAIRHSQLDGYEIGMFEEGEFTQNEVARKLGGPERWAQ